MKKLAGWITVAILGCALLGCGGGVTSTVAGVATPGAISVVTAN